MIYNVKLALLIFGAMIAVSSVAPVAKADEWNKETLVTFSGPIQISGKDLPAGTYVFKLADSDSDRDIVQIFTKDRLHLITTFMAVPKARLTPADTTILTFEKEPTVNSEVVKSWFYPGDTDGLEFVDSK